MGGCSAVTREGNRKRKGISAAAAAVAAVIEYVRIDGLPDNRNCRPEGKVRRDAPRQVGGGNVFANFVAESGGIAAEIAKHELLAKQKMPSRGLHGGIGMNR